MLELPPAPRPVRLPGDGVVEPAGELERQVVAADPLEEVGELAGDAVPACRETVDAERVLEAATAAQSKGEVASARRSFDRAARALEAARGISLAIETVSNPNLAAWPQVAFSADGRWVLGSNGLRVTVVDLAARRIALSVSCSNEHAGPAWFGDGTVTTIGSDFYVQESLHPNYWGQLAMRDCLRQAYNGGAPHGGTCQRAGIGLNGAGEPLMTLS